ncbi:MAG: ABC transporter ATP-binding protein [Clostridiales bacterium]|nr:ABC transporter ATP-binding protein [Clostridiales bacterium]
MIELTDVTKRYGSTVAIDKMSLAIKDNGIYCLLGRNGAGKTTLMKLLAGHITATAGRISVCGLEVSRGRMPECVSYIESGALQFDMKVGQLIDLACDLTEDFDKDFAGKMLGKFNLDAGKKYKKLSFGMKTMLTTIISVSNNSEVILLDEPTLGFDAIMRDQFNTLLLESYENHPRIIIVSTHLIDEIAKVTEHLMVIEEGRMLLKTGIGDIDEKAYTLSGLTSSVSPLLEGLNCIGKTQMGSVMAAHIFDERIPVPDGVTVERMSLQDFFINFVGGKSNE